MAIVAADNTQCRFNINAYRMVFVVNKENLLYKRQALHRARQVSFVNMLVLFLIGRSNQAALISYHLKQKHNRFLPHLSKITSVNSVYN
jgi:hypothetical protein